MKNIHVLPTNKPSRLSKDENDRIWLSINFEYGINDNNKQNIFITSDEEIKEGDWYFDGTDLVHKKTKYNDALVDGNEDAKKIILTTDQELIKDSVQAIDRELCFYIEAKDGKRSFAQRTYQTLDRNKKIILTTDQDLIKDGVQAIDDEFLEWFVKNPSCEKVEVEDYNSYGVDNWKYLITIPEEKQKQHLIDIMKADEELGLYEEPKQTDEKGKPMTYWGGLEKPKQETLEEAAEFKSHHSEEDFIRGGRWQQERSYSEEEVLELLLKMNEWPTTFDGEEDVKEWFEQIKKK